MKLLAVKQGWSILLMVGMIVAATAILPGRVGSAVAAADKSAPLAKAPSKTVQIHLTGMTCEQCAKGLEASIRKMPGVLRADVDYKAGLAVITFETSKQSVESLSKFVAMCGYQVKETKSV